MKSPEEQELERLERRDRQLWLLALSMLGVLTLGLIVVLVPMIFGGGAPGAGLGRDAKLFYALSVLMIIFNIHLVRRQSLIRQLRRELLREELELRSQQGRQDLLSSLPGREQFHDSLAMQFRRAQTTAHPLSVVSVVVDPERKFTQEVERSQVLGEAAKALRGRLRSGDTLYRCTDQLFCALVPGMTRDQAHSLEGRLTDTLTHIREQKPALAFTTSVVNFPADTRSATQMASLALRFRPLG
jgi:GGDEF domain-containing protein